jgi:FlaA1/EpsC-like NDP-sugar epimerase
MQHPLMKHMAAVFQTTFTSLSRRNKRLLLFSIDFGLFLVSIYCALGLRFGSFLPIPEIFRYSWLIFLLVLAKSVVFQVMGLYRPILRYTGLEFLFPAAKAVLCSSGVVAIFAYLIEFLLYPPRSVLINDAVLTLLLVVGARLSMRWLIYDMRVFVHGRMAQNRIIIYGAGVAGSQLAQALNHDPAYSPVAFVDDNPHLQDQVIQGLTVYSPTDLPRLLLQKPFDTILLAMPSVDRVTKSRILERLKSLAIPVKTIPGISDILSGKVSISEIRDIDIADLLGREEVLPDPDLLQINVTGKSVLVTGAGGSIGSELCRQVAQQRPKCLVLFELSEFALYSIDMELAEAYPTLKRVAILGSVLDQNHLSIVLTQHQVDTIYHAAAYKHVHLVEINPAQGIFNNVLGTLRAAHTAMHCGVSNFVLISTDKAVRPTNVMGATKRLAELILQALADQPTTTTHFTIVRFGNVLDSSGSVVPRFRKQITEGKPITLTHPDATRYFMSIPEAARLVIQAGALGKGGEIFLLDMGEPVRIYDLALQMIRLSGLVPGQDIEIQITGLRPGEKLHEELLIESSQVSATRHPKIFSAHEAKISWKTLEPGLKELFEKARWADPVDTIGKLQSFMPEYQPGTSPGVKASSMAVHFSDF